MKRVLADGRVQLTIIVITILACAGIVWLIGSANPQTPAGYVGYLSRSAVFGRAKFVGTQIGPTSPGRGWLLRVVNVSVTPYTYTEDFEGANAVLASDNLAVQFRVHVTWHVDPAGVRGFVEHYATLEDDATPGKIVQTAYDYFLKEPLRTAARAAVTRYNGFDVKANLDTIGASINERVQALVSGTPFVVTSLVVGNIQYPGSVADAVAQKLATAQLLEQKATEIEIEKREAQKRVAQADGIAKAMQIINEKLTARYLQHEAIEAQKAMVGSPNHTTIYLPVGPMGVPIVGTVPLSGDEPRP